MWYSIANNFKNIKLNLQLSHYGVIVICIIVISGNLVSSANSKNEYANGIFLLEADSNKLSQIIDNISLYTLTINENVDNLKNIIALKQDNGYLAKDDSVITEASKLETEYIVQKGDTISGVAKKFNMHVATLLDRNSIKVDQIEGLHPGQKIIIPPKDTSDSQSWLAELNAKKEKDRQIALKATQQQKAKLAVANRSTVTRERSSTGYSGDSSTGWSRPISYKYVSRRLQRGHYGIDMVVDIGTSVYAAKSGMVVEITRNYGSGFGNSILIDHGNGITSRYAHLSAFNVGIGDNVDQGQLIAQSGNTGWSTGPHLHFETRSNGVAFDTGL